MRTVIAGSRDVDCYECVRQAVQHAPWRPSVILSGGARGADKMGEVFAGRNNIPLEIFPADWDKWGKSAGYRRNSEMADNAEALIAVWDGQSRGTGHMIDLARKKGLEVFIQGGGECASHTERGKSNSP